MPLSQEVLKLLIHNPDDLNHVMRIKPVGRRVTVTLDGLALAETTSALRVLEIGRDLYDPVFYIPKGDVGASLSPSGKSTHCPLKGETTYYDVGTEGEGHNLAWEYTAPRPGAEELSGHVAFDTARVTIEEAPHH